MTSYEKIRILELRAGVDAQLYQLAGAVERGDLEGALRAADAGYSVLCRLLEQVAASLSGERAAMKAARMATP